MKLIHEPNLLEEKWSQGDRADENQVGQNVHSGVFLIPYGKNPSRIKAKVKARSSFKNW